MTYSSNNIFNIPEINKIIMDYKYDIEVEDYKRECDLVIYNHIIYVERIKSKLKLEQRRRDWCSHYKFEINDLLLMIVVFLSLFLVLLMVFVIIISI